MYHLRNLAIKRESRGLRLARVLTDEVHTVGDVSGQYMPDWAAVISLEVCKLPGPVRHRPASRVTASSFGRARFKGTCLTTVFFLPLYS